MADRAALTPDREALVDVATGIRYRYAELARRANRVAHALRRLGVRKGDRVAVLAHNCVEYVDLLFAAGELGAVIVPLNWRLTAGELAAIAGDCEPALLVYDGHCVESAAQLDVPHSVGLGTAEWADLIARASDTAVPAASTAPDDPWCIMYTSGTTGRSKGAVIPHRQVLWNCISTVASAGLGEGDVAPVFTPLFHAGGLFAFLTPILYVGGRVVLAPGVDGERDLDLIEREGCTAILGVPTMYRMWRESAGYRAARLAGKRFFTGGAPMPPSLMHAWRDEKQIVFRQGYGLTEVGPNCFSMTDAESVDKGATVGRPVMHLQARLGDGGELCLRGPQVCGGYWRDPESTAAAIRDGWFHTGDVARLDDDGFFSIVGRRKEMIISGGENVYCAEVEAVFCDHPAVSEAALIGASDERWGEVGVMVVIPRAGRAPSEPELIRFCDGRLARFKIPKRVVFADDFPRTALGKPQKAELARRIAP